MALQLAGEIALPKHAGMGGFDHAAIHRATRRLYVAHTANDALDVIDCTLQRYTGSVPDLAAVAGALVSDERDLVFTSNRGENTVGIFSPKDERGLVKVPVGVRPNGLAHDPGRHRLVAANVGDPAIPGSFTVTLVDVPTLRSVAEIPVAGRTRWTVFDAGSDSFYVNVADPPVIEVLGAVDPVGSRRRFEIPSTGPHGLDIDVAGRRLFCACDAASLVQVHADSGEVLSVGAIAGAPDVIFFNPKLAHLYVAIGDPGLIEVIDTTTMQRIETVTTEPGAHTLAFDGDTNTVYAFLPASHRAAVYVDHG